MPELPEVETVRTGLARVMEGRPISRVIVRRPDLRRPIPDGFAAALEGRVVVEMARRAKYLVIRLDDGQVVLAHLGMSGRMVIDSETPDTDPKTPHEHITFLVGNGTAIRFSDPRRFGLVALTTEDKLAGHPLLAGLGPEPLSDEFDGAALALRLKGCNSPIKAALLDQKVVAGLGNIYVCEALWLSGISPRRKARTVRGERANRLVTAVKSVLLDAIASGGSTLRDHVAPSGEIGYFQHSFKVYGHEGDPCPACDRPVQRLVQSGRSTFLCPTCQR